MFRFPVDDGTSHKSPFCLSFLVAAISRPRCSRASRAAGLRVLLRGGHVANSYVFTAASVLQHLGGFELWLVHGFNSKKHAFTLYACIVPEIQL